MSDVLIVDDNVDLAELLQALIEAEGHHARLAHDGQAGLEALSERLPELVLLDVDMPVLDGPAMAYRMLVEDCGRELIPIVLLSANVDLDEIARRVGTPYVLTKPCAPEPLLRMVHRALDERRAPHPGP